MFRDSELTQHLSGKRRHSLLGDRRLGSSEEERMEIDADDAEQTSLVQFSSQLLLVYYVLQYQDTMLNNMKNIGRFAAVSPTSVCQLYMSRISFCLG